LAIPLSRFLVRLQVKRDNNLVQLLEQIAIYLILLEITPPAVAIVPGQSEGDPWVFRHVVAGVPPVLRWGFGRIPPVG
jgi:hypothetical protein